MQHLFESLQTDKTIKQALACFQARGRQSLVYGITGSQKSVIAAAGMRASKRPLVIITATNDNLEQWRTDLTTMLPDLPVVDLPAADIVTFTAAAKSLELTARRMDVLGRMARGERVIVLTTAEGAAQKVLPKQEFLNSQVTLSATGEIDRTEILESLVKIGYERVDQVDSKGQFSVRGGIIDVFPVNRALPVRIELFGDEIDSMREFETVTQRSVDTVQQVDILPVTEPEHSGSLAVFLSYLSEQGTVLFDEPARLRETITKVIKENPEIKNKVYNWQDLVTASYPYNVLYFSLLLQKTPYTEPAEVISITAKGIAPFHRQMELVVDELKSWHDHHFATVIMMSSQERAQTLQQNLIQQGISATVSEKLDTIIPGMTVLTVRTLSGGFELPQAKLVVITEKDIFGRQKKRMRQRVAKDQQITYFRDLNVGDYVVHVSHGIGKYVGVETLEVAGIHKDYLHIRYAGEDKLYVPTDQVNLLQKYIGAEGDVPRLHKMGGTEWIKAKTKAKAAVADLAKELIALYAERQVLPGYAFEQDTPWQREFEEAFPFEETPDQLTAIGQIKKDMEQARPMDRLLCGDVGFGKTEVAIRAAFKAVMGGKQVAVLVPTTVLAQQHYQTFSSRFNGFGPAVDVVSRFRSTKEQKATLSKVAMGQCDVLIGTHRLLNQDVTFKDLGLLIVDEEQRFGVAQKEKLKRWRTNIDVLTLSATPIPRTLHMSLVGARDMSIIETPPEDRFPVQTYVVEYSEAIIRDAIRREMKRGGQIYFVYNRVQSIDKISARLSEMLPDARIGVAHGQMPDELLEQVMLDFYEGHYDILVCTSLIENGLDVANANTMIVYDADHFGLSQLYQMRGRVGRSHRLAFAYFTYRRDKVLTEVAEKRLHAIKEFTELGAGFKIAMRDLEIRGAGNILGAQQSGHIVSVGFEMYCRLLDEAIHETRTGEAYVPQPEPILEFNIDAYLSGEYITDAMQKIEIYQRIAAVRTEEHVADLTDELIDRFGEPPEPVLNLLAVARIKNFARLLGMRTVLERSDYVEVQFADNPAVDGQRVMELPLLYAGRVSVLPGPPPALRLKKARLTTPLLEWVIKIFSGLAGKPANLAEKQ
ncbi:transcription-repair coupling factor [Anaerospora hongkongensis]|uniref:transcription-repair coupling factor n=1 Tax=Anaerospora hongkongensis TaxID=244830 RepID=UPI0028A05563|nr:transcription-repair coupling factor [Anaerospora hongkongensis]